MPGCAQAQWWSSEPADYEDCAQRAEKNADSKQRETLLAACEAKFAGRRKPGGGYTYYDFMQDKHFDIAGPNPTAEEQREIDRHYTEFLDQHRRSLIAAAFARRQRELSEAKTSEAKTREAKTREAKTSTDAAKTPQTTGKTSAVKPAATRPAAAQQPAKPTPAAPRTVVATLPGATHGSPRVSAAPPRPANAVPGAAHRPKPAAAQAKRHPCKEPSLSCNWSRFTDGVSDLTRSWFRPSAKNTAVASGPRG